MYSIIFWITQSSQLHVLNWNSSGGWTHALPWLLVHFGVDQQCLPLLVTPMPVITTTITLGGRSESISIIYPFSLSTVVYFWARRVLMERKRWAQWLVMLDGRFWWRIRCFGQEIEERGLLVRREIKGDTGQPFVDGRRWIGGPYGRRCWVFIGERERCYLSCSLIYLFIFSSK